MKCWAAGGCLLLVPIGASAATPELTGTVLLPSGKPAAHARVWYARMNGPRDFRQVEGRADARGRFRLAVPGGTAQMAVLGGQWGGTAPTLLKLAASPAKGKAGKDKAGKDKAGKDKAGRPLPVTLKLSDPVTLSGCLVYSDRKPAIGVPLRVVDLFGTPGTAAEPWGFAAQLVPEAVLRSLGARSDSEGRFRLPGLPPQVGLRWATGGDGVLSDGSRPFIQLPGSGRYDVGRLIVVRPGAIDARLLDPAGQPLPGATLHVRRAGPVGGEELASLLHRFTVEEPQSAEADGRGFVHLEGLQPGPYELAFRGKVVPVEVKEGEIAGPVVLAGRVTPFTGKVVDAEGRAAVGARVTVEIGVPRREWPPSQAEPVIAGVDGSFSMADFPWMASEVVMRAVAGTGEGELVTAPGSLKGPVTLTLAPNRRAAVRGKVLGPGDGPLGSAQVLLFVPGPNGPRPIGLGATDASGSFQFDGLRPDATFRVAVAAGGRFLQSRPYTLSSPGLLDLGEVSLTPAQPGDPSHRDTRLVTGAFELLAIPAPAELTAAEDFAFRYLQAVRSGELAQIQALTSPVSPGYSADPVAFARTYAPLVPPQTAALARDRLTAIPLVPRFVWGLLVGPDVTAEAARAFWPYLDRPEWAVIGYRGRIGVNVLLVARKERDGWKAVGGLQFEPAELMTVQGDRELFGQNYPAPESTAVLAAANRYLSAWRGKRMAEMHALTHPAAVEYAPGLQEFTASWSRRPDPAPSAGGPPPRLETRFRSWDLVFLLDYPRLLARLRGGEGPSGPRAGGFPLPEVRAGAVAVVRYDDMGTERRMLLARRGGKWLVVEPSLAASP